MWKTQMLGTKQDSVCLRGFRLLCFGKLCNVSAIGPQTAWTAGLRSSSSSSSAWHQQPFTITASVTARSDLRHGGMWERGLCLEINYNSIKPLPPPTQTHTLPVMIKKKSLMLTRKKVAKEKSEPKSKIRKADGWAFFFFSFDSAGALRDKLCIILGNMFITTGRAPAIPRDPFPLHMLDWNSNTCCFISDASVWVNWKELFFQ